MFSDPEKILNQCGLVPGMHVADLGSGIGFYAIPAALAVGARGRVYAVDVQRDLLLRLKKDAEKKELSNIEIIHGDVDSPNGTHLAANSSDAVIIANVLFQSDDKAAFLKEAVRILKPNGRLLLVDWSDSFGGTGPQAEHVLPQATAKALAETAGFLFDRDVAAGDQHYGMIFRKKPPPNA